MASPFGIQGQMLEVTVVGGYKLRDTEWFSRQDPYVCLEYASTKHRTRTCTDGGKNPTFNEKFTISLIEGLREMNIQVWNKNTLSHDDFIGSGKVQLINVLSQGYDDTAWTIQSKSGRYTGEIRLILHYGNANKPTYPGAAPQYPAASYPQYPPSPYPSYPSVPSYPPPPTSYPPPASYPPTYPPPPTSYPPPASYPSAYPPPTAVYPPSPYPSPAPSVYPYPTAPYPGTYPPRPY